VIQFVFIFLMGFVLSLLFTPVAKFLAYRFNFIDQPGFRKIHAKPIPRLGGWVIFASLMIALVFSKIDIRCYLGVLLVGLLFLLFGLIDDRGIEIRARYKITAHLAFSLIFVLISGISFNLFKINLINLGLTVCFITFMTNSLNMLDGMDGLVSGVATLAALFFCVLALNNNLPSLALLTVAFAGSTLGFLRYNFNPASIFLGEGGSTFIGFILAVIALNLKIFKLWNIALLLNVPRLQFVSFLIPLIILGIPIFDTFFVFMNRFFHNVKMSTPGKDHAHHRIHLMGLSQKITVLAIYGVQIMLGAIALAMVNSTFQQFVSLLVIVFVLAFFAWVFLLRVEAYPSSDSA